MTQTVAVAVWYAVNFLKMGTENPPRWLPVVLALLVGQIAAFLFTAAAGIEFNTVVTAQTIIMGFAGTAEAMFGAFLHNQVKEKTETS